jgi:hypothetical protein
VAVVVQEMEMAPSAPAPQAPASESPPSPPPRRFEDELERALDRERTLAMRLRAS